MKRWALLAVLVTCSCGDNAREPLPNQFRNLEIPSGLSCAQDGTSILIGTRSFGLHRIDRASKAVLEVLWLNDIELPEEERGFVGPNDFRTMARGPDDELWLGTGTDIVRYDDGEWSEQGLELSRQVLGMTRDSEGTMWATVNQESLGGELYRRKPGEEWQKQFLPTLPEIRFRGITGRPGGVWIASNIGIVSLPTLGNPIVLSETDDNRSLSGARSVALDSAARLWAGFSLGAGFFDGESWQFFGNADDPMEPIPEASINTMISAHGSIWAGSAFGHLVRIDAPGEATAIEVPGLRETNDSIEAICVTETELWVVSLNNGVYVIDLD